MKTRNYSTDEITVHWKSDLCTHAGVCVRMLPEVYRPKERPWVRPEQATTEELIAQIDKCPSGALSYTLQQAADKLQFEQQEAGDEGVFKAFKGNTQVGEMLYRKEDNQTLCIYRTNVFEGNEGQGIGGKLVNHGLSYLKENNLKVVPECSFVQHILEDNDAYAGLKA